MVVQGKEELASKLKALASKKELNAAMRAMVREPMRDVMRKFQGNLGAVSPGERDEHRTYKGRLVSAGFASRSVRMAVRVSQGSAYAVLGVLAEAFYVLQFFELGTAHIAARPMLVPAFASSREQSVEKMADVMRERIESIATGGGRA